MKLFAIIRKANGHVEEFHRAETATQAVDEFCWPWKYTSAENKARSDAVLRDPQSKNAVKLRGTVAQRRKSAGERALECRLPRWDEEHYARTDYLAHDTGWNAADQHPIPDCPTGKCWGYDLALKAMALVDRPPEEPTLEEQIAALQARLDAAGL